MNKLMQVKNVAERGAAMIFRALAGLTYIFLYIMLSMSIGFFTNEHTAPAYFAFISVLGAYLTFHMAFLIHTSKQYLACKIWSLYHPVNQLFSVSAAMLFIGLLYGAPKVLDMTILYELIEPSNAHDSELSGVILVTSVLTAIFSVPIVISFLIGLFTTALELDVHQEDKMRVFRNPLNYMTLTALLVFGVVAEGRIPSPTVVLLIELLIAMEATRILIPAFIRKHEGDCITQAI
ncbi:hypothetical protein RCJ22_18875 [Vibrio sp. FNV 38]|nr:hypothetical protein [Vibrio sp. FNV 38]